MSPRRDTSQDDRGPGPHAAARGDDENALTARLAGRLPEAALVSIARRHRHALSRPAVARAFLRQPSLPSSVARDLAAALPWRVVAEAATDSRGLARTRRVLAEALARRTEKLGAGERTALARIAPEPVLSALARTDDSRVLRAVLTSPKTSEGLARSIAAREDLPEACRRELFAGTRFSALAPPPGPPEPAADPGDDANEPEPRTESGAESGASRDAAPPDGSRP